MNLTGLGGRDGDAFARRQVAARALGARAGRERAEADQLYRVAAGDGLHDRVEDGVDGRARAGLAVARLGRNGIDEFLLVHIFTFSLMERPDRS